MQIVSGENLPKDKKDRLYYPTDANYLINFKLKYKNFLFN